MYTYSRLSEDLSYLSYCGVDVGSIGLSTLKNAIPYVHVGSYHGGQAIITGGIHARENVTSLLVMRQAFRAALVPNEFEGGIYFIPMVNPDGALLIEKGAEIVFNATDYKKSECKPADDKTVADDKATAVGQSQTTNKAEDKNKCMAADKAEFLRRLNGSDDFRLWKANINGVDLNNNFDARFGLGAGQKTVPAPQGYIGEFPFSEAETLALKDFTIRVRPQITLSYHALGRELYWYFFQKGADYARDESIATEINDILGYKRVDSDMDSSGGYKDWCVDFLKIPSLTVEVIAESLSHPLNDCDLEPEWQCNKDIPYALTDIANRLYLKKYKLNGKLG